MSIWKQKVLSIVSALAIVAVCTVGLVKYQKAHLKSERAKMQNVTSTCH